MGVPSALDGLLPARRGPKLKGPQTHPSLGTALAGTTGEPAVSYRYYIPAWAIPLERETKLRN